jgi:hypothetical protein
MRKHEPKTDFKNYSKKNALREQETFELPMKVAIAAILNFKILAANSRYYDRSSLQCERSKNTTIY